MLTDHDHSSASLALGGQATSSSSSSSSSLNDNEEQQQTATNRTLFGAAPTPGLTLPNPVSTAPSKTKRSASVAHDDLVGHRSVIFHVDLEHGGDNCGVLQLSVVAYDPIEGEIVGALCCLGLCSLDTTKRTIRR
jgi:hypothetical protein